MKKLVSLLLAAILCLSAVGSAFAAVDIDILCWMSEQEPGITAAIDAFNESQDEIYVNVSYLTRSAMEERLQISFPSGEAPDIISMNVPMDIDYSTKGYLLDVSDLYENGSIVASNYPQHTLDSHTVNGKINGVVRDYDCVALFYNKALFDAAGVAYPTDAMSWDEFMDLAAKMTDKEAGIHGYAVMSATNVCVYDYMLSAGAYPYDENGYSTLNSEACKAALQKLADAIHVAGVSPTMDEQVELSAQNRFINGQLAMFSAGSWSLVTLAEALGDDLGVVIMPAMGEKPISISNSLTWGISYCTKHPEEAKKVLTYLASFESQAYTAQSVIPAFTGTDAMWVDMYKDYGSEVFLKTIEAGYGHGIPYAKVSVNEVNTMVNNAIAEVLKTGDVSILDAHVAEINKVIDEANAALAK